MHNATLIPQNEPRTLAAKRKRNKTLSQHMGKTNTETHLGNRSDLGIRDQLEKKHGGNDKEHWPTPTVRLGHGMPKVRPRHDMPKAWAGHDMPKARPGHDMPKVWPGHDMPKVRPGHDMPKVSSGHAMHNIVASGF